MRFVKMHGAGNDYVYVDCFSQSPPVDAAELARRISDRHFGVGGDGLILIEPSRDGAADARMRMFNADGSEAEMCGNGIRCVAKYLYDRGIVRRDEMRIETGRGILPVAVIAESGLLRRARVGMGVPIFQPERIPTTLPGEPPLDVELPMEDKEMSNDRCQMTNSSAAVSKSTGHWSLVIGHSGRETCGQHPGGVRRPAPSAAPIRVTCLSMGNPHCVVFVEELTDELVHGLGPLIERHPAFPQRTNVEFVQVLSPTELRVRVWERGSGETLACGTGACAAVVAAALSERSRREALCRLPGGELEVAWSVSGEVFLTGEAVEVFEGEWPA